MTQILNSITHLDSPLLNSHNTFSLKSLFDQESIFVDFQTHFITDNQQTSSTSLCTLPTYNLDKNYFTPAFCLKSNLSQQFEQQSRHQQNLEIFRSSFENKKNSYAQTKNQPIFVAKPQSNYCQICQQSFEDYKKHIVHPVHAKKLKNGRIQPEIYNLINHFQSIQKNTLKRQKPVQSKTQYSQSQSQEVYSECHKKIKKNVEDDQSSVFCSTVGQTENIQI